jgi:hypothetical protein
MNCEPFVEMMMRADSTRQKGESAIGAAEQNLSWLDCCAYDKEILVTSIGILAFNVLPRPLFNRAFLRS